MEVVAWSLVVLTLTIALAQIIRRFMRRILKGEIFSIFDESLASMQCSIGILECGVISGVFGPWSWISISSAFIFSTLKHFAFIRGKYVANPVSFIDRYYIAGKVCPDSPMFICTRIGAMIVGALIAHPVSRLFWGKTYSSYHNRAMLAECKTTLTVPFMQGFMVEFITTLIAWAIDSITPVKWKPPVRSAVSISLVMTFLNTSGAWMNPATASAHTLNCSGHENPWEHFIAYWIGPYLAAILFYEMKEFWHVMKEKSTNLPMKKREVDGVPSSGKSEEISRHLKVENKKRTSPKPQTPVNGVKYHRSPGGALRQRVSSIGPG